MDGAISIKGTREGLTITLGNGDTQKLYEDLSRHLKLQGAFFRGGIVALDVGKREMDSGHLCSFRDLLAQHTMILRTVVTADPTTLEAANGLGLRTIGASQSGDLAPADDGAPKADPAPPPADRERPKPFTRTLPPPGPAISRAEPTPQDGERGLILRRRVRAGQTVRHAGSVLIIGDVNTGGEVIAGGDVVVWGKLRGTVHAGYPDNAAAMVCALDLAPMQLRLGSLIARPDESAGERRAVHPEVGYVRDGTIVVERWNGNGWEN